MGRSIEQLSFLINSPYKLFHTKTALGYQLVAGRNRVGKQGVIIALLSLALVCISLNPVTLWAATHTAASCSRYDVGNAVNSAGDGDTVLIPAGNCTWTTNLTIDGKYLTLQGAGAGTTIITDGVSKADYPNIPQVLTWITINGGLSRLTGITFHGGTINDVYNKGIVLIEGASHQFRIDHCKFIPTESAGLVLHGDLWG